VSLETHGRWPLVGALGLIPASLAAVRLPTARPLAALLWHQSEEWVWPGSFLPWINREVLGSDEDEFPIDRRLGFVVNVLCGWGFSLAPVLGRPAAAPAALLYVSHLGNGALHVSWAVRHRRYDPGAVTSVAALAPVAISGLRALARDPSVSRRSLQAGATIGLIVSAGLLPALKWRIRRRQASP
jgi:Protein of unknown function with HXXEE motif